MSFSVNPNLPQSKVKAAILSGTDNIIVDFVKSFGINVYYTEKNTAIDSAIAFHADINTFYFGNGDILIDSSQNCLINILEEKGFNVTQVTESVKGKYPNDCKLNCAALDGKLIARVKSAEKAILDLYEPQSVIDVNQGYARCSVCIVNENSIITDDPSIHKSCRNKAIESLLIEKGDVRLSGHNYGFIGGASMLIDKNKLIFFGDIRKHRNYKEIDCFLKKLSCEYCFLPDYDLTDIGGAVIIEE